jgi:ribosome biogenesis GTPase / thiamine phosphate phosphatase
VLPRKSRFSRLEAGGRDRRGGGPVSEQVVAANIDVVFIVSALDDNRGFNLRRLERYLTLAWNSGASPALILNKSDLSQDLEAARNEAEQIAPGVPVLAASALHKTGLDAIYGLIGHTRTAAFIGPSGVGKSSLINQLLEKPVIKVGPVRQSDSAGHHTTTSRELYLLASGGAVIDTPGLREIQLWSDSDSLAESFPEIQELSQNCRFVDCAHQSEPGCAVQAALADGTLDPGRFDSYLKLQKELRYLDSRRNDRVRIEEKARWRKISQLQKQYKKLPR